MNWPFDGHAKLRNVVRSPSILSIALWKQGVVFLIYVSLRLAEVTSAFPRTLVCSTVK